MDALLTDDRDDQERVLTVTNAIEFRSDVVGRSQRNRNANAELNHEPVSTALSFTYFLQTQHDKVTINCKEVGKLLGHYDRVDVDVYVSPLSYDFKRHTPVVQFKHKPKHFHINVITPGTVPQPPDGRPPYGLGEEVSLDRLSLATNALRDVPAPVLAAVGRRHHSAAKQAPPRSGQLNVPVMPDLIQASSPALTENTPTKDETGRKRRRADELSPPSTPDRAKRPSLHRNCKPVTESGPETPTRSSTRRKNPAYT